MVPSTFSPASARSGRYYLCGSARPPIRRTAADDEDASARLRGHVVSQHRQRRHAFKCNTGTSPQEERLPEDCRSGATGQTNCRAKYEQQRDTEASGVRILEQGRRRTRWPGTSARWRRRYASLLPETVLVAFVILLRQNRRSPPRGVARSTPTRNEQRVPSGGRSRPSHLRAGVWQDVGWGDHLCRKKETKQHLI